MIDQGMSLERFQELIDRFGCRPSLWPEPQREPAQALLAHSPQAQQLLAQAEQATAFFTPKAPTGLADRIVAAALTRDPGKKPR